MPFTRVTGAMQYGVVVTNTSSAVNASCSCNSRSRKRMFSVAQSSIATFRLTPSRMFLGGGESTSPILYQQYIRPAGLGQVTVEVEQKRHGIPIHEPRLLFGQPEVQAAAVFDLGVHALRRHVPCRRRDQVYALGNKSMEQIKRNRERE